MMTIELGGKNTERLFLYYLEFKHNNTSVLITPTDIEPREPLVTRHKSRYGLVGLFVRPENKVLDFPCGSGYGSSVLEDICNNFDYEGRDKCPYTIEYAKEIYRCNYRQFITDDLKKPKPTKNLYNVIACIEGLEHIEQKYQLNLIKYFYNHLAKNGVLVISSPETLSKKSGVNEDNPYHLHELTKVDFKTLLYSVFPIWNVEIISFKEKLSDGKIHNCFYGICHK